MSGTFGIVRALARAGLGLSTEAQANTFRSSKFFSILPDSMEAFRLWRKLVGDHGVMSIKVTIMRVSDIQRILTFNAADFTHFPGIEVIHPDDVEWAGSSEEGASS